MPELKRPLEDEGSTNGDMSLVLAKKAKHELMAVPEDVGALQAPKRSSKLDAAIMLLSGGHEGEIYCGRFHPKGEFLASAGFDRQIMFWKVYGECENFHVVKPSHGGAIVDLHFSEDGRHMFTASTDKTVGVFDAETGQRTKRLKGHSGYVNACCPASKDGGAPQLVVSASDDCSVKVWDSRHRGAVASLNSVYQVTAVCFGHSNEQVVSGGIDNAVKVWDLRKTASSATSAACPVYELTGHTDTITGMATSPVCSYVLTNSMDNTLRIWDVRPYASADRCVKILTGHKHNFEKNLLHCSWAPDGSMVAAGSADRFVYIWDTTSRRILYRLPGHQGSVNDVDFHKMEPIVLSVGSDKQIYLGELPFRN